MPTALTFAQQDSGLRLQRPSVAPFPLQVERAYSFENANNVPVLNVIDPDQAHLLANFQIELIVDCSTSMTRRDCPNGLSRWQWCGMQSQELANALASLLPGLTVTTFSGKYEVHKLVSPQIVADIFQHPNFDHGTRLAAPLRDRLYEYFDRRTPESKPLLIVVITDGVPYPPPEPDFVENELIRATRLMQRRHEVTIVFFQIGQHEEQGEVYLEELGKNLVRDGGKYRIVHTILFKKLKTIGLSQALVDVVKKYER
ncbi:MAG: hypothetical protein P4L53_07315 [Candidatus Obscuribacterales bacterium]|nr:hypothetical protein [Candidatus Obscuribacterales bacterium]